MTESVGSSVGDGFVLELAPVGDNVRTARIFGASIARHFNCDEELVEDLKLALSESMSLALQEISQARGEPIRLTALRVEEALAFSVKGPQNQPGSDAATPKVDPESKVAPMEEELILALFPDATFGSAGSTEFTVSLVKGLSL